jgi:hypothetical protein
MNTSLVSALQLHCSAGLYGTLTRAGGPPFPVLVHCIGTAGLFWADDDAVRSNALARHYLQAVGKLMSKPASTPY